MRVTPRESRTGEEHPVSIVAAGFGWGDTVPIVVRVGHDDHPMVETQLSLRWSDARPQPASGELLRRADLALAEHGFERVVDWSYHVHPRPLATAWVSQSASGRFPESSTGVRCAPSPLGGPTTLHASLTRSRAGSSASPSSIRATRRHHRQAGWPSSLQSVGSGLARAQVGGKAGTRQKVEYEAPNMRKLQGATGFVAHASDPDKTD